MLIFFELGFEDLHLVFEFFEQLLEVGVGDVDVLSGNSETYFGTTSVVETATPTHAEQVGPPFGTHILILFKVCYSIIVDEVLLGC